MTLLSPKKIRGTITSRTPEGELIGLKFEGEVTEWRGMRDEVLKVILEAEMDGNSSGEVRIHLYLE